MAAAHQLRDATLVGDGYAVYDDVLEEPDLSRLWDYIKKLEYGPADGGRWQHVWRPADGSPIAAPLGRLSNDSRPAEIAPVIEAITSIAQHCEAVFSAPNPTWQDLVLSVYAYPRGTRLSLHCDTKYCATCVLWVHPRWGGSWGGELMLPDIPAEHAQALLMKNNTGIDGLLDRPDDKWLLFRGSGRYVTPKRNRLVMISRGTFHCFNRVDPDAGEHLRCSVNGIFLNPQLAAATDGRV